MSFCMRLVFGSNTSRAFVFEESSVEFSMIPDQIVSLVARNADKLIDATAFHIEAAGFSTADDARVFGNRLRLRLQLLNAMMGLGLHVPETDRVGQSWTNEEKERALRERNDVLMDSVQGVAVFPDDGRHYEAAFSGRMHSQASDPAYIFTALKNVWPLDIKLDEQCQDALSILSMATTEPSPKTSFLTTYLALETLLARSKRSEEARTLIERFAAQIDRATHRKKNPLAANEAASLKGSLAALREESFSSALTRLVNQPNFPKTLQDQPTKKFISTCISVRNKIAHQARLPPELDLNRLAAGLSYVALSLIWARTGMPDVTVHRPASQIVVSPEGLKIRVL